MLIAKEAETSGDSARPPPPDRHLRDNGLINRTLRLATEWGVRASERGAEAMNAMKRHMALLQKGSIPVGQAIHVTEKKRFCVLRSPIINIKT